MKSARNIKIKLTLYKINIIIINNNILMKILIDID